MKTINQYITEHLFSGKKVTVKSQRSKYDYIDLGLPSGTLWATCNIGTDNPEEQGLLFQWGRTDGYKYNDNNHNFLNDNDYKSTSGRYYTLSQKQLILEDDAAYKLTNGKFRMPTSDELEELFYCTEHEWIGDIDNIQLKLTSKTNNNSIIITGNKCYNAVVKKFFSDNRIYLWSANACQGNKAIGLYYYDNKFNIKPYNKAHAFQIRAVLNKK